MAITELETIGGRVKKEASIYPRPCSFEGEPRAIDWAVMQVPFGNEFCLVRVLDADEIASVVNAAHKGTVGITDEDWRHAAGRTGVGR